MLLVNLAANHHGVHDRKNLRPLVILFFHVFVVFKKAAHVSGALRECGRHAGRVHRVDLSITKHVGEDLVGRDGFEANFRRQRNGELLGASRLFFPAAKVRDAANRNLVIVTQDSPDPHARG